MLNHLYIKSFTLIDELDISFYPGFSVITGETGAGKSIILGAINLLLGQRADTKQIKPGSNKCIVEAQFDLTHYELSDFFETNGIDPDLTECIIRREISLNGKSRAFINDTPVALTTMRELGEQIMDIHSQHQNLLLQKEDFQLHVVDIVAKNADLINDYKQKYGNLLAARKTYETFKEQSTKSKEDLDYLEYQLTELDRANLKSGEQEELVQQVETLSHAEEIKGNLFQVTQLLAGEQVGCIDLLKEATDRMSSIVDVYQPIKDNLERIQSAYIEIKDLTQEIENLQENFDYDPHQLQRANERLDEIYSLEHKFKVDNITQLIAKRDLIKAQLENVDHANERLAELLDKVHETERLCISTAEQLTATRKKAASKLEEEIKQRLIPLGIPKIQFLVDFQKKDCSPNGADNVCFLFSANSGSPVQPITQVASGGEIARVMLSIKDIISGTLDLPTIIFDEIDTGVSGRVAEKMAQIMRNMGRNNRQVISITHLPQIASMGSVHYKVSKEETPQGTITQMQQLSSEERLKEIAQMLSGSDVTEAAIENARTLLKKAQE